MRFESLKVSNLRAIRLLEMEQLGDFIVVAGQNGSGKSCIFDAIRLLKSAYGGYQSNEYHHWFGEFGINFNDKAALFKLFRDPSRDISVRATMSLAPEEVAYIRDNTKSLVYPLAVQQVIGAPIDSWTFSRIANAPQIWQRKPEIDTASSELANEVVGQLSQSAYELEVTIQTSGDLAVRPCTVMQLAFQTYKPLELGVIEYHSASRSYSRQQVGGINLDSRSFEDQRRQYSLYNWQNKYQNVKTELAASYLRNLIADKSGKNFGDFDLNETLKELFATFFPSKSYEGVQPDSSGGLSFPVRLATGEVHDIDELSSGEKEILYGYLKLRNSTPAMSVILLDEPELHLNPSLLRGFADFYHRHLGIRNRNQIWLVTHSDALLRQAVGNSNFRVYHMTQPLSSDGQQNQVTEVFADEDADKVTIDLVGDLASYQPRQKVVILEGKSDKGFDVGMVSRLFPEFARRVNLVSGGYKQRVSDLWDVLAETALQSAVKNRFFAIVDRDFDTPLVHIGGGHKFQWDVYHIENYLINIPCIQAAVTSLLGPDNAMTESELTTHLRECAESLVDSLVLEHVRRLVNERLRSAVDLGGNPKASDVGAALYPSVASSASKFASAASDLTEEHLNSLADQRRKEFEHALADGTWISVFPGRDMLEKFASRKLGSKATYNLLVNVILDKMVENTVKPEGMERVLDAIIATN